MTLLCTGSSDEDEDAHADDDDSEAEHDASVSFGSLNPSLPLRKPS